MISTRFNLRLSSNLKFSIFLSLILVLLAAGLEGHNFVARQGWGLLSAEIILLALVMFYWRFEETQVSSRYIAVIAVLGTLAGIGRIPFASLPDVQPTTFMVIISGFVLGPQAGFLVGSSSALISGFFLGQGPWIPWQMFAWGLAGILAGMIKMVHPNIGVKGMVILNAACGYLFGWLMNLWFWTAFISPLSWQSYVGTCLASFWFDTCHAGGNVIFYLVFGSGFIKILKRFQRKLDVRFMDD